VIGGLAGAVAEALSELRPTPLARVGLRDTFAETGPYEQLLDKFGMGVEDIVAAARAVLARKRR
jgi:transketolase